jgi:hypothetical protein
MPLARPQVTHTSQIRAPVTQQQLYQVPRPRELMRQKVLYQAPQARASVQQTQRQAPTGPTPTSGFSIRGAAGPNQQVSPTQNQQRPCNKPQSHQQPPNRQPGGGRKRGREGYDSGDKERNSNAEGQSKRPRQIAGRQEYSRKNRKQNAGRQDRGQGHNS